MPRPDGIPLDVWGSADQVVESIIAELIRVLKSGEGGPESMPEYGLMVPFIARAIMAEREACAQVAQGASPFRSWPETIAEAIRNRGAAAPDVPPQDAA